MTNQAIKRKIVPTLIRQGVTKAALFGSASRGEMKRKSDIDILVKLKKGKSLFDFIGLKLDLEKKLGKKVDLVTYDSIKPRLKKSILKDEKIIYEKRTRQI
jgi:uncharacterized protein